MNDFEKSLLKYFSAEQLKKIQNVRVGIAGAGGLGSNCAVNLVRSGFKKFVICDFDSVEFSNLNRQFYFGDQVGMVKVKALKENLLRINPGIEVTDINKLVTAENIKVLFENCDAVVEAFDKVAAKKMITEYYLSAGKFFVSASGLAGWGNSDEIKIRRVRDTFHIVGDMKSEASEKLPPCSPRVNVAAAKEADIILEWVLNS
ncbi:MAG: sulfur carrier protein ThiS adenylyltransferase ThiF [Elusimicrobiales bacterium]|nr:sulfur carrier protein ThiS adenylyltransferase ThiF [Elusimicrobiales bacterium]